MQGVNRAQGRRRLRSILISNPGLGIPMPLIKFGPGNQAEGNPRLLGSWWGEAPDEPAREDARPTVALSDDSTWKLFLEFSLRRVFGRRPVTVSVIPAKQLVRLVVADELFLRWIELQRRAEASRDVHKVRQRRGEMARLGVGAR